MLSIYVNFQECHNGCAQLDWLHCCSVARFKALAYIVHFQMTQQILTVTFTWKSIYYFCQEDLSLMIFFLGQYISRSTNTYLQ